MDAPTCYGGGDIAGAVFGTLIAVILLEILFWWLYRRYVLKQKGKCFAFAHSSNYHFLAN
jgi:hypothetical protein